ncbi:MAG TPA: C40 family peptidase [Burkholderiaceae bacterium]|nr:C40 family peptidase [Burkholderiaceae bacterium]
MRRTLIALGAATAWFCHSAAGVQGEGENASVRSDIVVRALTLVDTPYRYGGSTPEGFDCSGLVRYVYQAVAGRSLPRRSEEMGKLGESIARSQLEPGDLVFFNTLARAYSHVAIYIGEGRFLHAPARGGRVRIEGLDDRYWRARFDGARRLVDADAKILRGPHELDSAPRKAPRFPLGDAEDVIKP